MKNWSLNAKIYFIVFVFFASNVFAIYMGLSKLSSLNDSMTNITGTLYKRIDLLNGVNSGQLNLSIKNRDLVLSHDKDEQAKIVSEMITKKQSLEEGMKNFMNIASEQGKALGQKYQEQFSTWWSSFEDFKKLILEQKFEEAAALRKVRMTPLRSAMGATLAEIVDLNEKKMRESSENAAKDFDRARRDMILACALAMLFGAVLCQLIIRDFGSAMKAIIGLLSKSSVQVASTSRQIASASQELSQSTSEQAASLEETAASIEEMTSMVAKNTENAKKTASTSMRSQETTSEGKKAVERMIDSMEKINQGNVAIMGQIHESNQQMADFVKVIQEIGSKTKVINDIVFQTKLLSFNASVEAARAGEHGKGFAVVAEEVGNLAQMSGNAAKEISGLLEGSIKKVENLVAETRAKVEGLTQQGKQEVDDGVRVAKQCDEVLGNIVTDVSSVATMATEISSASQEQSLGITEINKAMSQLDQVTQQNAAAGEQASNAAEELSTQAETLKTAVDQLISTIEGSRSKSPAKRSISSGSPAVSRERVRPNPATAPKKPESENSLGDGRIPDGGHVGFKEAS